MPVDLSNWTAPSQRFDVDQRKRQGRGGTLAGDFLHDLAFAPVRAVEGAFDATYGLVDAIAGDALPDIQKGSFSRYLSGEDGPRTIAGSFTTSAAQFALGFVPVVGWLGRGTHVLSKAAQVAARAPGGASSVAKALAIRLGRDTAAGAVVDATFFEGQTGRLSDLAIEHGFSNQLTEYLATDEDDSEIVGRFKNAVEGGALGIVADGVIAFAKTLKLARNRDLSPKHRDAWERHLTDGEVDRTATRMLDAYEETRTMDPSGARKEVNQARREAYSDGSLPTETDAVDRIYSEIDAKLGLSKDGYLSEQGEVIHRALRILGPAVEDIRVEFTQGRGERSSVDLANNVITLSTDAAAKGKLDREFVHEVFHVLQGYVGKTTRAKLTTAFNEAKAAALAKDPGLADRLANEATLQRGDYQYLNEDEWFAEIATAKTLDEGDAAGLLSGGSPEVTLFAKKARYLVQGAFEVFRGSYGDDVVQQALSEVRRDGTLRRSTPLPGAEEAQRLFAPPDIEGEGLGPGRFSPEQQDKYVRQPIADMLKESPGAAANRNKEGAAFQAENPINLAHVDSELLGATNYVHAMAREIQVHAKAPGLQPLLAAADKFALDSLGVTTEQGAALYLRRMSGAAKQGAANVEAATAQFRAHMVTTMELARRHREALANLGQKGVAALDDKGLFGMWQMTAAIADALAAVKGGRFAGGRLLKSFHLGVQKAGAPTPDFKTSAVGQKYAAEKAATEGAAAAGGAADAGAPGATGVAGEAPAGAAIEVDENLTRALQEQAAAREAVNKSLETQARAAEAMAAERTAVDKADKAAMQREETEARRMTAEMEKARAGVEKAQADLDRWTKEVETAQKRKEAAQADAATERARARQAKDAGIMTPFEGEFDNDEMAAFFQRMGGRKAAERMMLLNARLVEEQGITLAEQLARLTKQADRMNREGGFAGFFTDWWYFSLLSKPTTLVANALGNAMIAVGVPIQRMLGGATLGALGVAARGEVGASLRQAGWQGFQSGLDMLVAYGHEFRTSMGFAADALVKGEGRLSPNSTPFDPAQARSLAPDVVDPKNIQIGNKLPSGGLLAWQAIKSVASIKGPGRALLATDEFAKQMSYRALMYADAMFQARQLGIPPAEQGAFVARIFEGTMIDGHATTVRALSEKFEREIVEKYPLMANEPAKLREEVATQVARFQEEHPEAGPMAQRALGLAERMTLTNSIGDRLVLEKLSRSAQDMVSHSPLLRFFVPFVRTPANLMLMALDNTVGVQQWTRAAELMATAFPWFAKTYDNPKVRKLLFFAPDDQVGRTLKDIQYGQIRNLMSKDPQLMAEQAGKLTMAMGIGLGVWGAVASGSLTGAGPEDPDRRRAMELAGWKPYSFKIGDRWVSYARLDPFASMLGIFADAWDFARFNEDPAIDPTVMMGAAVSALGNLVTEKSYFRGLAAVIEMVNDPTKAEKFVDRTGAVVLAPGIVTALRDVSEVPAFDDPALREMRGILDRWKDRLPGLSRTLPPRRNFLGETQSRYTSAVEAFTNAFIPLDFSTVKDDTIARELELIGHGFSPPSGTKGGIDLHAIRVGDTTAYDRWLQLTGTTRINGRTLRQEMTRIIKSPAYQRLPTTSTPELESPRLTLLRNTYERYKARGYSALMSQSRELSSARRLLDNRRVLRQQGVSV